MFKSTGLIFSAALLLFAFQVKAQSNSQGSSVIPEPREVSNRSEMKPHFGARLGVADPGQNYNSAAEYGIEGGIQPLIPYGVGLEVSRYVSSSDRDGAPDMDRIRFLARGTFNFGGDVPVIKNSYVGLLAGPVFDTVNSNTDTKLAGGLVAGADFPVGQAQTEAGAYTLGASANYLLVDTDADVFSVNGAVKYWF